MLSCALGLAVHHIAHVADQVGLRVVTDPIPLTHSPSQQRAGDHSTMAAPSSLDHERAQLDRKASNVGASRPWISTYGLQVAHHRFCRISVTDPASGVAATGSDPATPSAAQ